MFKQMRVGLFVFFSLIIVAGAFAIDPVGIVKSATTDINYADQMLTDQGDDFASRAAQALTNAISSLQKLVENPAFADAAKSCCDIADKAKVSLVQQDFKIAQILVNSLKLEIKALTEKVNGSVPPPPVQPNPVYEFKVWVQGIVTSHAERLAAQAASMLKAADQNVLEIKITSTNGYGVPCSAVVRFTCRYPINDAVLKEKQVSCVSIDGIWGGDSFGRISQQVSVLKCADIIVLGVFPTSYNGYGKICSAQIWTISKARYEEIMKH
ncbi:MAG: hypothetical protein HQM08_03725 [Candidatus Riflebacteria bacterium]|nr:hypothetical protein [Candidatus Riflebacteria bacterium]